MDTCDKCGKTAELYHNEATGLAYCDACETASHEVEDIPTTDCVYLTRAQIQQLYSLTFGYEAGKQYGTPRIGVQIRGNADATKGVVLDAVLSEADELASATIDADGAVTSWTI